MLPVLEDDSLPKFIWRRETLATSKTLSNSACQTDDISCSSKTQQTILPVSREVQTDVIGIEHSDKTEVDISPSVIQLLLDFIRDDSTDVDYDRLLEFHQSDNVVLENVHSYRVETWSEPIVKMIANVSRRTCILIGSNRHETFCSHQPRALVCTSTTSTSISLSTCALAAVFLNSYQLAIGELSGSINIYNNGVLELEHNANHGPITSLQSTKHGIISSTEDGWIDLWRITKTGLESVHSIRLTVSDLPRSIRKTSSSRKSVAIVDLKTYANEALFATETGGLYHMELPSLNFRTINQSPNSVKSLLFNGSVASIIYHQADAIIIDVVDGSIIQVLPIVAKYETIAGQYLIFSNNEQLIMWSCETRSIRVNIKLAMIALATVNSDVIQILNADNQLISFCINER